MYKDLVSNFELRRAISPVSIADTTAAVSQIIDMQGLSAMMFAILTGSLADADATFTVLVEEGDDSSLSDAAAVADVDLLSTEALASFAFDDDDSTKKIGYKGSKRYVRLTITPVANASAALLAAVAVCEPRLKPAA